MLEDIPANLKSVEVTSSDTLAGTLSKMEQYNGSMDIRGLLKKHLGRKFTSLYPIVRTFILIIDARQPLQLRIHVVREYYRRIIKT